MREILRLVSITDKSLWRNNINEEVGFILDQKRYMNLNSLFSKLISSDRREESSKAELIVRSSGKHLVELILESEKWAKLFPTIVSNARTVKVFNAGAPGNRNGALQAMVGEVHILSPLVPPREFYFIRYCRQFSDMDWVIVDVSGDFLFERANVRNPAYKLPSGCLIREMPDGKSKVTWVEHVMVNEMSQELMLYKDLTYKYNPFGAKLWLYALQRMCAKNYFSSIEYFPKHENDREIRSKEVRKSVMNLSNRMIQSFCKDLNRAKMNHILTHDTNEYKIHLTSKITNPNAIRLKCCSNSNGMVVTAMGSVRLHVPPQTIFHFLSDERRRPEWDSLVGEREVHEVAYISIGEREIQSYNRISILEMYNDDDDGDDDDNDEEEEEDDDNNNNVQIFQEVCIDPVGAYVVYTPVSRRNMHKILNEENSSDFGILPWGFMISKDGHVDVDVTSESDHHRKKGSLVTFSIQVLVPAEAPLGVTMERLNSIFTTTIEKIQNALDCEHDD
ncbi:homeobox-leucine zipper protein HDG11 [Trifolium repens]|nr:homeobox-leucine zipper protein HDG11 [Trifolium repens]